MKSCCCLKWSIAIAWLVIFSGSPFAEAEQATPTGSSIKPLEVPPTPSLRATPTPRRQPEDDSRRIYFERPRLGLGLAYHYEEEVRQDGRGESRDTIQEWRERLLLETRGWIYNPALMKLRLRLEPELRQTTEDRDSGDSDDSNNTLAAYFVETRILDPKPISLRLFGQRQETTLRSAFAQSSDSEIDTYGADLFIKNRWLPTTISYVHRDVDQSGFFDAQETQEQYSLVSQHNAKRSNTRINATYSESERTSQGTADGTSITNIVDTLNADLHNDLTLTNDRRVKLNSFWNYRTTDFGDFKTTDLRLRENLHWQHRPNFRTDYNAAYSQTETNDLNFETVDLGGRFTHLYKDRLTTTGGISTTQNTFDSGDEQIYRTNLDFTYRRPIGWGRLNLFAGGSYDVTTRNLDSVPLQVIGESQTLSTASITFLNNPNVILSSVRVTNSNATTVFVLNVDYTLQQIGTQTRISRTVLGAISEDESVLVDYRFISDASFDDTVLRQRYGAELFLWEALTLSYRYRQADQSITSGPNPTSPADEQVHTGLVRYTKPRYETRFLFEDSERESGISTTQWRVEQTLRQQTGGRLFGSITGAYSDIYFKELNESEQVFSLRARGEYLLRSWSKASLEGFWESVSGDVREVVDMGVLAKIEFSYRIWNGSISYSYLDEDDVVNEDRRTRQTLMLELIRIPF